MKGQDTIPEANSGQIPPFLTRKQLCDRWGTSTSSIKRMEKAGKLEATTFGQRLVRYRAAVVLEIERQGNQ